MSLRLRLDPLSGGLEYAQPAVVYASGVCWFDVDLRPRLGDEIRERGLTPDILHYACFVGFLALQLDVATADEVVGDYGIVHEVAHGLALGIPLRDVPQATVGGGPASHSIAELAAFADELQDRLYPALVAAVMRMEDGE